MTDTTQTTEFRAAAPKAATGVSGARLKRLALGLAVIAGVALSGGSRANCCPLAGDRLATRPSARSS